MKYKTPIIMNNSEITRIEARVADTGLCHHWPFGKDRFHLNELGVVDIWL